jgi:hypothetical protein
MHNDDDDAAVRLNIRLTNIVCIFVHLILVLTKLLLLMSSCKASSINALYKTEMK